MRVRYFLACFGIVPALTLSYAQSLNIDLDDAHASPPLGGGPPSSLFGAAAGQVGFWNAMDAVSGLPFALSGLDGQQTAVSLVMSTATGHGFGRSYRFEGNTGDYALLLNDATSIGGFQVRMAFVLL